MSFPNTVTNFLQLQDGVDKVLAAHPNDRGNEITAIETLIGAFGNTQSYTESIRDLLRNYLRGCAVEYKSAADLYVRSGEIALVDSGGNLRLRRNTSDLTVTWADIDTGAEATSTTYYVYAVGDSSGTTFTVKISTSASAPTGCTYYKKLGSFYNDSAGDIIESSFTNEVSTKRITGVYYSGFFAVALGNNYNKSHNLGTIKCIVKTYLAQNSDGSGWCIETGGNDYNAQAQCMMTLLSTTSIRLNGKGGVSLADFANDAGARLQPTSGYACIVIIALA